MSNKKTALFVTYGGGHARMAIPVIRALADCDDIRIEALALTGGGPIFKSEGVPYKGFRDFITPSDTGALDWGKKLAAIHHSAESGIEEDESIAYLGLCYWDLVSRHGDKEAARLWEEKGRHAFLPLTVMERVITLLKPDIVVTTNSPKSEQAAIEAANRQGIQTLSMVDLFGIQHFHTIKADIITVLCKQTIENMRNEGVDKPDSAFIITGNPAFDRAFDYRGPVDHHFRKSHFPDFPEQAPILLWIDSHANWDVSIPKLHIRSEDDIIRDLDTLSDAAKINGGCMLVRPHPSQPRPFYDEWMREKALPHVAYAGGLPLYPLLKAVDAVATHNSTVSVEALLMERRVLQLKYQPGKSDVPLGDWGIAWQAEHPAELPDKLKATFYADTEWKKMQARIAAILPQERAAPKIAALIKKIVL